MEFDRRIKTTASYQSQGINLSDGVTFVRYSHWLLSILMIKNLPIRFTTKATAGDQFNKTEIAHKVFLLSVLGILGLNFNPSNPCTE